MNAGAHGGALHDVAEAIEVTSVAGVYWMDARALEWSYRSCDVPDGCIVTAARLRLIADEPAGVLERQRGKGMAVAARATPGDAATQRWALLDPRAEEAARVLGGGGDATPGSAATVACCSPISP